MEKRIKAKDEGRKRPGRIILLPSSFILSRRHFFFGGIAVGSLSATTCLTSGRSSSLTSRFFVAGSSLPGTAGTPAGVVPGVGGVGVVGATVGSGSGSGSFVIRLCLRRTLMGV